jgi:hypothetical protein
MRNLNIYFYILEKNVHAVFWHFEINLKLIDQIFVKKLFKSQLSFNSKLISCTFRMVVGFTTSANPVQGEVYSIQHYVIKFQ